MSSPTKAPVEFRHRLIVSELVRGHGRCAADLVNWIQAGYSASDAGSVSGRAKLNDFAQALADTEAAAYARGLADGAERERAAVVACLTRMYPGLAVFVESGKHRAGESE